MEVPTITEEGLAARERRVGIAQTSFERQQMRTHLDGLFHVPQGISLWSKLLDERSMLNLGIAL